MREKWINDIAIQGYVFNFGNDERRALQQKVTGPNSKNPGMNFIQGELNIATDDKGLNVITVYYQYVPETWPAKDGGKPRPNTNYDELMKLLQSNNTFEKNGTAADKIRLNGNLETNDFYTREGELASPKRIRGGFVHPLNTPISETPATFSLDCVLSKCVEVERENEEPYVTLSGYCFDFRNSIYPFDVNIRSKAGMNYFLGEDISNNNPMVTSIKGNIVNQQIKHEETIESAFGDPVVQTSVRNVRSWDITWAAPEPMEWDDESVITKVELKKALQERMERIEADKKRADEYRASQEKSAFNNAPVASVTNASVVEDDDDSMDFPF